MTPPPAAPRRDDGTGIPKAAISVIVVVALVLVGVSVWALVGRGAGGSSAVGTSEPPVRPSSVTSAPTPTDPSSASSNGFPDTNEQALLAHIPSDIARTCMRYTQAFGNPIASVYCAPYPFMNDVQYNLYTTAADTSQAYATANTAGISGGDCTKETTAEHAWFVSGTTIGGRILCFRTAENTSAIFWTNDDLRIMAWASRGDSDNEALYEFWLTAGPNP